MQSALRPYFTTGVAIVGASVIAVAPLSIPPAQHGLNVAAAVQHVTGDVQLTALADITGSFDGLVNAALAGIALSLDLQGSVDVNADFATNLANLTGAIIGQITDAFGTDPITGLMDLLMLPVNVVTGLVTGVLGGITGGTGGTGALGGLMDLLTAPLGVFTDLLAGLVGGIGATTPGGIVDTLAQLVAAPIRFGLTALQTANDTFTGLLTNGIDLFSGLLAGGLTAAGGFASTAITTGADLIGGLFAGAGGLLLNGATAIAGLLTPLTELPVVGPFVTAFVDVWNGFANAGATGLTGIGDAISGGGAVLAGLVEDLTTTFANVITGGSGVLTGAIDSGSTALNQVLQGFLDAVNAIVPPPAPTMAPTGGAASMLAATKVSGLAPTGITSLAAPAATTVTLPTDANSNAQAATSGSTTVTLPPKADLNAQAATSGSSSVTVSPKASTTAGAVTGVINGTTSTGVDFGKEVSGAATSSTTVSGGGTTTGGTTGGAAHASAGGSAHANAHAKK